MSDQASSTDIPALLSGTTIAGTINSLTAHVWQADSTGLFQTGSDLASEWRTVDNLMLNSEGYLLTPVERMEANAEAVFDNTRLSQLSAAQQQVDRQDAQREYDAIGGAMAIDQATLGIDPNAPLTESTYLALENTIQSNPTLEELAVQGHGLNDPPDPRYDGFTNDFQNADPTTRFIGIGTDDDENAIAQFFDNDVLTHVPFPTVVRNGEQEQLDQNGGGLVPLRTAVMAFDNTAYYNTYTAADFSKVLGAPTTDTYVSPAGTYYDETAMPTAPPGAMVTLSGNLIPTTIPNGLPHVWVADASGEFHTPTDLGAEWQFYYQVMQDGDGALLNPIQRMEGNAQAVFLNTNLSRLSAGEQEAAREDAQREFDAMAGAMEINAVTMGISINAPFVASSYLALEHTLQSIPILEELAIQGHGLNSPPDPRYSGYTNDFQTGIDGTTDYVGPGVDSGERALADFFDDDIMTHVPFAVIANNGTLVQLNQNGVAESSLDDAIDALNMTMFQDVYTSADFRKG